MCGIAGIFKFNSVPVEKSQLKKMTDVISHRGPDGEGHWINASAMVGFGHRRLSIIDLSNNGSQPMHYLNNRYTITFNGEIYNYLELKQTLLSKGYQFVSDSDTEVLLAMYDWKKENCLMYLDGMFAFAIWDEKEQELFCARDRFGEKPFHYYLDKNEFVFGSEIKQFWAYGIEKKIVQSRMLQFLESGQIDDPFETDQTFYHQIKRLDPAHFMLFRRNGIPFIKKYWDIDLEATFQGTMEEATDQFYSIFKESVSLRLRADVSVGTSLSGGLDSSSICMIINLLKADGQKQTSFSARFKNFEKDEGIYIEEVLRACKNVEANFVWPDENYFFENFTKINYHQDEPYTSTSMIAQYSVMELAKTKGITVLIDGQGADECLGGYMPYYKLYLDSLFYTDKQKFEKEKLAYDSLHSDTRPYEAPDKNETFRMKLGRFKKTLLRQNMPYGPDALKEKLYADTSSMHLQTLLRYADRNSMANSREVRLPFLSHRLIEFIFTLPDHFKLNSGWTKYILRKAMDPVLPRQICWRTNKVGYESPQEKWLQHPAILSEIISAKEQAQGLLETARLESNSNINPWRALIAKQYL